MAPTPWQQPMDGTPDKVKYICFVRQYDYVVFLFELGMGMDIQFLLFEVRILFGLQFCSLKGLFSDRKLLAHRMIGPDQPPNLNHVEGKSLMIA